MSRRSVHRADANQAAIVRALLAVGCSVLILSMVGNGCPDLLVGYRGRNFLLEVKGPSGRLMPSQVVFCNGWRGQWEIVRTEHEALRAVGALAA